MRVALFTNAYKPITNGVVTYIAGIKNALLKEGHKAYVFAPEFHNYEDDEDCIYRYKSVDLTTKVDFPVAIPYSIEAYEILKDFAPDIIHVHHPFVLGRVAYRYAKRLNVPIIFTFHTDYGIYSNFIPFPDAWVKTTCNLLIKDFANKVTCITVPSQAKADLLRSYGVQNRIEIIHNSVNIEAFDNVNARDICKIKEKYGLTGFKVLLYVGRIAHEKNIKFLLDSFERIYARDQSYKLLVVGDGPQLEELKECAGETNAGKHIIFTGSIENSELPAVYKSADIFVFASPNEGFPMVIMEAMAAKLPIVSVNAPWTTEVMTNGFNALMAPEDPERFCDTVINLLGDSQLYEQLQKNGIETANNYSLESVSKRLFSLYDELIKNNVKPKKRALEKIFTE
ncbi:MAG TPA: glycosyltransferase [Clostridia bacterium]|mgnify:CR=1 FL=1|nr:glycosyltransferase [Clostridia bacterium]